MNFVTAENVIINVFTNRNTDPSLIKDITIQESQLEHIKPVLTKELYELIETENNATNLSGVNQILFDTYVVPAMYYFVKYEGITDITIKSNSKGLNRGTGNYSKPADGPEIAQVLNDSFDNGMQILKRMTEFLNDNESDYPTYDRPSNPLNEVSYLGGIIY